MVRCSVSITILHKKNLYKTKDFREVGNASFVENKSFILNGEKPFLMLVLLQNPLHNS